MWLCLAKAIVGCFSSYDRRDQSKLGNKVLLLSCVKDIERHKSLWSFTGVTGEQELILLRAGIFTTQQDVSDLTICPFHRSELGTGWRGSSNTCRVPNEIAHHWKIGRNGMFIVPTCSQLILFPCWHSYERNPYGVLQDHWNDSVEHWTWTLRHHKHERETTYERMVENLKKDVEKWVNTCDACQHVAALIPQNLYQWII